MAKNITPLTENFSQWYQDIIQQGDLADQSPVRGCMVFKPTGYSLWENIQSKLDTRFKETGHTNAYFPLLIPESFLQKEKDHIAGFSPELAVVTHAGGKELEESLVVRPTSEAIIGSMYAKWIKSYRDLPLLINQWCNVMRWEMRPRMFLRTSEFLWQEGHTAHETAEQSQEEALKMLGVYREFLEKECLIPVFTGKKPAHEKFPGALTTYALEAMMQDGKALQAGTSHDLGQNFSKVFSIKYLTRENTHEHVWTTSWGVSTRIIGGILMVHGDNDGVVFPPSLAPLKVVLVPMWKKESDKTRLLEYSEQIAKQLSSIMPVWNIKIDQQNYLRPVDRFFEYIQKGVPIRLEIGEQELTSQTVTAVRRDSRQKIRISLAGLNEQITEQLKIFADNLWQKARAFQQTHLHRVDSYDEFKQVLATKGGFLYAHWDGTFETADLIQKETKATIRVLPDQLEVEPGKCVYSGKNSARRVLFAQSY